MSNFLKINILLTNAFLDAIWVSPLCPDMKSHLGCDIQPLMLQAIVLRCSIDELDDDRVIPNQQVVDD